MINMEFFRGEALISTKFFRVDPYSSGKKPIFSGGQFNEFNYFNLQR